MLKISKLFISSNIFKLSKYITSALYLLKFKLLHIPYIVNLKGPKYLNLASNNKYNKFNQ